MTRLPSLCVHKFFRNSWTDYQRAAKGRWTGTYTGETGTVNVDAMKPWIHEHTKADMPGHVFYRIVVRGLTIYYYEPFYRTPKGACIIASRLLRTVAGMPPQSKVEDYHRILKARWSNRYGVRLEP